MYLAKIINQTGTQGEAQNKEVIRKIWGEHNNGKIRNGYLKKEYST